MSTETGQSNHHNTITTFMRANLVPLQPKRIKFNFDSDDPDKNYTNVVDNFRNIVDKHAPLKQKTIRGNEATFMNRNIIYTSLKNNYNKIQQMKIT